MSNKSTRGKVEEEGEEEGCLAMLKVLPKRTNVLLFLLHRPVMLSLHVAYGPRCL
jgi:hypothetical protein